MLTSFEYKGISNEESNDFGCICCDTHSRRVFYNGILKTKEKEKEEQFWKVQEARVEKYIRYNIEDVKSITFTKKM